MGASVDHTGKSPLVAGTDGAGFQVELEMLHCLTCNGLTSGQTRLDEHVETFLFACPPTILQYPAIKNAGDVVGVRTPVEAHGAAAIVGVDVDRAVDRLQVSRPRQQSESGAVRWGAR